MFLVSRLRKHDKLIMSLTKIISHLIRNKKKKQGYVNLYHRMIHMCENIHKQERTYNNNGHRTHLSHELSDQGDGSHFL